MQLLEWETALQKTILNDSDYLQEKLRVGQVTRETRIGIYSNAYRLRLEEALRSNYPAIHQLLGDEDFHALAHRYLETYPSTHASIRWFGSCLSTYLLDYPPYAQLPVLAELAQFEWALRHTIDAADAKVVTVADLTEVQPDEWGNLTFAWHPSLSVLPLRWNTPTIWQALTNDVEPPEPTAQAITWLVWREPNLSSRWRSIHGPESWALEAIRRGEDFSTLCEGLLRWQETDAALAAARLLRQWVEEGLLIQPSAQT